MPTRLFAAVGRVREQFFSIGVWNHRRLYVMAHRAPALLDVPDETLVRRFQETRDSAFFAELFARHRKKVFMACFGILREHGVAEDATQETFIRIYQNMQSFQEGDFLRWSMTIAKRICIDVWRKQRPQAQMEDAEWTEGLKSLAPDANSDLRLATKQLREEILALPEEQRRCLEMKIEGYSYQETAEQTGFSVDAVKSHLQNGRRMLWLKMEGMLSQLR